ncbi:MAG: LacI family DNA-binding transcriptional regulator [Actinomycetota bacterium]|nr:LacI family DNA-binding transcriptional regulator [Actinomycetota bacterium]
MNLDSSTRRRTATIADVAAAAGVSAPTVSRVVNNTAGVTPATRSRVEAAISELNYRPSAIAQGLAYGRTMTVGAVVPYLTHPSAVQRVRGLIEGLHDSPFPLSLYDVENPQHRVEHFELLTGSHPPMGTVVVGLHPTTDELEAFRTVGTPVVFIEVDVPGFSRVIVDHREGGMLATQHLIDLGHERIGFIGDAEDNPLGFTSSALHRRGYTDALATSDLEVDGTLIMRGRHGRAEARTLAGVMLTLDHRPTAVFAASDTQAMGVMDAARQLDLDIPGDLSVVGFDDVEMSTYTGLTTVHQPLEASGWRAAEILIDAIAAPSRGVVYEEMPLELAVRETTGSP